MPTDIALPDAEELCQRLATAMRPQVSPETLLVGIHTGGVWVTEWLHREFRFAAPPGSIDIGFHRDDHRLGASLKAGGRGTHLPVDIDGAHVVIVDDVLNTGRTIRAAMNELFDYGRPARVDLAVLVDRGGRELPIAATWHAQTLFLPPQQILALEKSENGALSFKVIEK